MRKTRLLVPAFLCLLAGHALAGEAEDMKATFDSGVAAYDAGDYPQAFKLWSSIDDVDLAAMRNVAMMLRAGTGVPKDPKKAEDLYEVAAEAGMPTAQSDLADMLLKGEAGAPDPKRALPLLEAAAAANHPIAQYNLATLYETGVDGLVPKDLKVARNLYAAAAGHGMKEAQARLDALGPATTPTSPAAPGNAPAPGTMQTVAAPAAATPPAQPPAQP